MDTTPEKKVIKLILQPNSERGDARQPGFIGAGSAELGLSDYSSGCYLSTGEYGNYLDLRFNLRKEFEGSGQAKQIKVLASQNKNCQAEKDDPHYRVKTEILGAKYKVKAWIRQDPTTLLFYVEIVFEEAEQIEPGELSPLARTAQQDALDFLSGMGVSVKPLPIEVPKTAKPAREAGNQSRAARDPGLDPEAEPDDIPFKTTIYRDVRNHRRRF